MRHLRAPRALPPSIALAMLAPLGCVDVEEFREPSPASQSTNAVRTLGISAGAGCSGDRMIARAISLDDCPIVSGWTVTPLLEVGSPWLENHPAPFSDSRGLLCRYERILTGPDSLSALDALDALNAIVNPDAEGDSGSGSGSGSGSDSGVTLSESELLAIAPDCEAIHGQRTSFISEAVGPMMRDIFREQIGWVDGSTLLGNRVPVAVSVIDTMPSNTPPNPRSEHGESMAMFVEDVASPAGALSSGLTVRRVLGLPRHKNGLDHTLGGYVASFGDLAAAISEAVQRWRLEYSQPRPPLILNLSLGWDPSYGDELDLPISVEAVETALEIASCSGALLIASTGNESTLCTGGALYPAAWESRPAPDSTRCEELGFPPSDPPPPGTYHPLVYAVGGLHVDGSAMPGTRPSSTPRITATATHAMAGDVELTAGLTGTSVAAATVSGAAALVWSYAPDLSPDEVMQVLYDSGPPALNELGQPVTSDVQLDGGPSYDVHRLDVCQALELACVQGSGCPGMVLNCAPGAAPPADLDGAISVVESLANAHPELLDVETRSFCEPEIDQCAWECGLTEGIRGIGANETCDGIGATVCEDIEVSPIAFLVSPQPDLPPCPNCVLTSDDDDDETDPGWHVLGSLDSFYEDNIIEQVIVTVSDGTTQTSFDFGDAALDPDRMTRLDLDDSRVPDGVISATVAVRFAALVSPVTNDVLLRGQ